MEASLRDFLSASGIRAVFLEFCKAGKTLNHTDERLAAHLAEALRDFMHTRGDALVTKNKHAPMMYFYSSDCTSYKCGSMVRSQGNEATVVIRRGKILEEFLMQRGFVEVLTAGGQKKVAVLPGVPRSMGLGKKTSNLFMASTTFHSDARLSGHTGMHIMFFCADRAVFGSMERCFKQRRELMYSEEHSPFGEDRDTLAASDFYYGVGCASHDAANAVRWGLSDTMVHSEVLKNLHVSIESLRNSLPTLHQEIGQFLIAHLDFKDPEDPDDVRQFWSAMGVEVTWLDLVCELDPEWKDGQLLVCGSDKEGGDIIAKVSTMILYLWRWKKFVETRWATIGPACRALMISVFVGLEEVAERAMKNPNSSNYFLNGIKHLDAATRQYAVVASIAAYPADIFQLAILEDDRLGRQSEYVQNVLRDEVLWVESLGDLTWERLASMLREPHEMTHVELRSAVLRCIYISFAYIDHKILKVLNSEPWSLIRGASIAANLRVLLEEGYEGPDGFTQQLLSLLRVGYDIDRAADGLSLLLDAPWTSVSVEQAHGSMGTLHRQHPEVGGDLLAHRSMLHQCRALFNPSEEDKTRAR